MHVINVMLPPVIYIRRTVTSCNTNFGVYQASETAASAPCARHVSHAVHDMRFMTFMLTPVIYIRHTVTSEDSNFCVYQASEMAASTS